MDMKKSLLISIIIAALLLGSIYVFGVIETNKKIEKNFILAKDEFENSKFDAAIKLLEPEPTGKIAKDYYLLKFNVLMNLNNLNQAEQTGIKLVKLEPKNAFHNYLLSLVYYNLNDFKKAEEYLKKSIENEPLNVDYKMHLANLYAAWGKDEEAIKLFEEVKEADPRYEVAWSGIATIYENKSDFKNALVYRKEAAEKFPDNSYDAYMLARLYKILGDKKNAIKYYAKAAELDTEEVSDARGLYYELTGKPFHAVSKVSSQKIPIKFQGGVMLITASVNGADGEFLLDTGASSSVIYEKFLKKNNLNIKTKSYGVFEMANGQKSTAPIGHADFKLQNKVFANARVAILPDGSSSGLDGIIGNDILTAVDYYIDKNAQVLIIRK